MSTFDRVTFDPASFDVPALAGVGGWTDLGQSARIAADSSAEGRIIKRLCPYPGQIVMGTGDLDQFAQYPHPIVSWNGSAFVTNIDMFYNCQVANIRVIDNVLYAIGEDALTWFQENTSNTGPDYVRYDGVTWAQVDKTPPFALHLWDMVKWNGALWLCGVKGVVAYLYKSVDGGTTWTEPYALFPLANDIARFYFIVALSGALYVQRLSYYTAGSDAVSRVTTTGLPGSWTTGPDMLNGYRWARGCSAVTLPNNTALLGTNSPGAWNTLIRFDGTTCTTPLGTTSNVHDWFMADDGKCYVLKTDRTILSTTDGATFVTVLTDAPLLGRSICAVGGDIYVGTEDSHLWRYAPVVGG